MRKQLMRKKDLKLIEIGALIEKRGKGDPKHDGEGKSREAVRGLERSRFRFA